MERRSRQRSDDLVMTTNIYNDDVIQDDDDDDDGTDDDVQEAGIPVTGSVIDAIVGFMDTDGDGMIDLA